MLTDAETNFLFLSDRLQFRRPFWKNLTGVLSSNAIPFGILKGTKDIWCVDYMPIQIDNKRFVQFRYNPDYLQHGKWRNTISDPSLITSSIGINTIESDLIVDGGNVVRGKDWVILSEKVFLENPKFDRRTVLSKLESVLEAKPIIIPCDPDDFTGHADGMCAIMIIKQSW